MHYITRLDTKRRAAPPDNYNVYELIVPVELIFTPKNPSHSVCRYGRSNQKLQLPETTWYNIIPRRTYNMSPWMQGVPPDQG
jgi:hypothetical protein